jgi:arsenate reductase
LQTLSFLLNHHAARLGADVRAYSAGSAPSGRVNPLALVVLENAGISTAGARSKSWDEFSQPDAPLMRVVITVCDRAASEVCPIWPGTPVKVHWGYPDPSNTVGDDDARRQAFDLTREAIGYRMLQLLELPLASMSDSELQTALLRLSRS